RDEARASEERDGIHRASREREQDPARGMAQGEDRGRRVKGPHLEPPQHRSARTCGQSDCFDTICRFYRHMEWLNYHHLLLFTTVVREGSLVAAGRALRLSHTTLSAQIRALEVSLGTKLVERRGRRLLPTDMGRIVHRYGQEIFGLGSELLDVVHGRGGAS